MIPTGARQLLRLTQFEFCRVELPSYSCHYVNMLKVITKKLKDPNRTASDAVALSTSEESPANAEVFSKVMAEMGRRGGRIGGKRRLETMTAKERKHAATKAANARWSKKRKTASN